MPLRLIEVLFVGSLASVGFLFLFFVLIGVSYDKIYSGFDDCSVGVSVLM